MCEEGNQTIKGGNQRKTQKNNWVSGKQSKINEREQTKTTKKRNCNNSVFAKTQTKKLQSKKSMAKKTQTKKIRFSALWGTNKIIRNSRKHKAKTHYKSDQK